MKLPYIFVYFLSVLFAQAEDKEEFVAEGVVEHVSFRVMVSGKQASEKTAIDISKKFEKILQKLQDDRNDAEGLAGYEFIKANVVAYCVADFRPTKTFDDEALPGKLTIVEKCDLLQVSGIIPPSLRKGDVRGLQRTTSTLDHLGEVESMSLIIFTIVK